MLFQSPGRPFVQSSEPSQGSVKDLGPPAVYLQVVESILTAYYLHSPIPISGLQVLLPQVSGLHNVAVGICYHAVMSTIGTHVSDLPSNIPRSRQAALGQLGFLNLLGF